MLSIRLATRADEAAISELMALAIEQLQRGYLTPEQIEGLRHSAAHYQNNAQRYVKTYKQVD